MQASKNNARPFDLPFYMTLSLTRKGLDLKSSQIRNQLGKDERNCYQPKASIAQTDCPSYLTPLELNYLALF